MFKLPTWIIVVIMLNVAALLVMLRPNLNLGIPSLASPSPNEIGQSTNQSSVQTPNQTLNQTFNASFYTSKCADSINNYIKSTNISNFTNIDARFFNHTDDAVAYVKNFSSGFYELIGTGKDIYSLNKSTVSIDNFNTKDGKSFVLPVVCDEFGNMGVYSSCALVNASNITLYCHNITESVSECDIEEAQHNFWEDINYWITPKPGALNESQLFNFTIVSSRNRLEYATLNIYYRRPPAIDKNLFNKSATTAKGDIISITTTLNLTGKIYGGLVVETYFKKKCYKYFLLDQYLY